MRTPIRTGIIGTGHLAGFLVEGCNRTGAPYRFIVSPRGREKAAELQRRFGVEVAASNQDVVDRSDLVIACVRPKDAEAVLEPLTFRADQTVLSLMAAVTHAQMQAWTSPATAAVGMMNGHANMLGFGATVLHPANDTAIGFLSHFGALHVFDDWPRYALASVMAGVSGTSFGLIIELVRWFETAGLDDATARAARHRDHHRQRRGAEALARAARRSPRRPPDARRHHRARQPHPARARCASPRSTRCWMRWRSGWGSGDEVCLWVALHSMWQIVGATGGRPSSIGMPG